MDLTLNLNLYADLLPKTFKDVLDASNAVDSAQGVQKVRADKRYDEKFTRLATRVAIAAVAILGVVAGLDFAVTLAFTAVILSVPAAALMVGFIGTSFSLLLIIDSLATGMILEFGFGVVLGGFSYAYLDFAGSLPTWGIVEYTFDQQELAHT